MNKFLLFGFLFTFNCYVSATYSNCGSDKGTLEKIEVTDCKDDEARCSLHRNTNATIQITFTIKEDANAINAVVHGIILDVEIPFILPNPDGCKDSGLTCPLKSGETYTYEATLPILKKYPKVTVDIKFELQDGDKKDIICGKIPAKIQ